MNIHSEEVNIWFDSQRSPDVDDWGLHLNHVMSGVNPFNWVENKERLYELIRVLPYVNHVDNEPDEEELLFVNELVDKLLNGYLKWEEARDKFNKYYGYGWKMLWWGKFDEILNGEHEDALDIREFYWQVKNDESENEFSEQEKEMAPIPSEMISDFIEWITDYGI